MSATWLTADLHLGHKLVAEMRGFRDPQEHDDFIVAKWRKVIQPDDDVWVLGDISGGGSAAQLGALATLLPLPGRKILVAGNHDGVHPMHGRAMLRWAPFYADIFEHVCSAAQLRVEGHRIRLSHFPRVADHTQEIRYANWRPPIYPEWLVHGHTHSLEVRTSLNEIHVGWDAWRRPVNLGEIGAIIRSTTL